MLDETRSGRSSNARHPLYVSGSGWNRSPAIYGGSARGVAGSVRNTSSDSTRNRSSLNTSPDWRDRYNRAVILGSGIVTGATVLIGAVLR